MIFKLINHTPGCKKLILIFTGWSTDSTLYSGLYFEGWDVAVVYDYSKLEFDISNIKDYATIWLFAWSLGVKAASTVLPENLITGAYAINGTLNPVDDYEGIPVSIYEGTLNSLNQRNLAKFHRRMSPDSDTFKSLFDKEFAEEEIDSLRDQLKAFKTINSVGLLPWRKAFISDGDKIFPPDNMKRSWGKYDIETVELNGAHYFPIEAIIKSVIPDIELIRKKFHAAAKSYDSHASAQNKIASHLCDLLLQNCVSNPVSILEIGPFTGLFTRKYVQKLNPEEIDFVDLFRIEPFNLAQKETYFCQDGEKWIENNDKKYDAIVSASTIQWFSNIERFISNCKKHLKPGGMLAISSFTSGNLEELDSYRPRPLHYPTEEDYKRWLSSNFNDYYVESEVLNIKFNNKQDLLMHLKYTGVSAGVNIKRTAFNIPETLTSLTYKPIYIIARL